MGHPVALGLLESLAAAAFLAALGYYLLRGRRCQMALNDYLERARQDPESLVEGSPVRSRLVRHALCGRIAERILHRQPAVTLVRGRAAQDRADFVAGMVEALATDGLVPVPVLARGEDALDLRSVARRRFFRDIDRSLSSESEADAVWRRAQSTRDLVLVVDGLDDDMLDLIRSDDRTHERFVRGLGELLDDHIPVVLVTVPRDLSLDSQPVEREQLDWFTRTDAQDHLGDRIKDPLRADAAAKALPPDDVAGFRLAPFYLNVIIRLYQSEHPPTAPFPRQTDSWRAKVLKTFLDSITAGRVRTDKDDFDHSDERPQRGQGAIEVAMKAAAELRPGYPLTIARSKLFDDGEQDALAKEQATQRLQDAISLGLLSGGEVSVRFPSDDLGAYLFARGLQTPSKLIDYAIEFGDSQRPLRRRDRHVLTALIFWYISHKDEVIAGNELDRLVEQLASRERPRPVVVATAIRVAVTCGHTDARLANIARKSVNWTNAGGGGARRAGRVHEQVRLVRALAQWTEPEAHKVLWALASSFDPEGEDPNQGIAVEWPAAKALVLATDFAPLSPFTTLEGDFGAVIDSARSTSISELSDPLSTLGNTVASLAWILPGLRDSPGAETRLEQVKDICCAAEMSPMRGEMSLAQGVKLALVNRRAPASNIRLVWDLLLPTGSRPPGAGPTAPSPAAPSEPTRPDDAAGGLAALTIGEMRFWHARLVLVQAALAYASSHPSEAKDLLGTLGQVDRREKHPLVKEGIKLVRAGMNAAAEGKVRLDDYMWLHERDAVRSPGEGEEVTRLVADTTLLTNMIYRTRRSNTDRGVERADAAATTTNLPRCIRVVGERSAIDRDADGCQGNDRCQYAICTRQEGSDRAVCATRARFSESFCREQVRLAILARPAWTAIIGRPPWTRRGVTGIAGPKSKLQGFWERQATAVMAMVEAGGEPPED